MLRHIAVQLLLGLCLCVTASAQVRTAPEPIATGFRACNRTNTRIEVAKAVNVETRRGARNDIISEGWYKLSPGRCVTLYPGRLRYRYYMVYAQEIRGRRVWAGNVGICVSHSRFRIRGGLCGDGYYHRQFKVVDTSRAHRGREGWTFNFID